MPSATTTAADNSESPVQHYERALTDHAFLWVVYYRGHWCPFCTAYLKTLQSLRPSIESAGGAVLIVTAEPAEHLPATRKTSGYTGDAIVDPEHQLATVLKQRGLLDVAITKRGGYEHGVAQPGVLVLKKDGGVLFDWAIHPGVMNLGGAKDRLDLKQIWENVQAKMDGKPMVHRKYATQTISGTVWGKMFG
ncbi:hypothetical protein MMC14_003425 [Varicellaria rhodocarpa]|nr:hypothetical protein [Varicellaria rhodocarpa]